MLGFSPLASAPLGDDGEVIVSNSQRRAVHVSAPSNNSAVFTDGANYCIITVNTPNAVTVAASNEAA